MDGSSHMGLTTANWQNITAANQYRLKLAQKLHNLGF
jgi:hypothetical protein